MEANDFVVTAGGDAVVSSTGDIYLDAGTIYFHEPGGTGSSMGFDGTTMSVTGRFQITDDTHAAITELSDTSYGTLLWDGTVETMYAPYLHGTAAEALESLHFGYGLNSATGRGGMRYVYYLPTSMPTVENTLTIGSATVEDFARINTSLMPIVFGGGTPTNYDIATAAGEVLFSEDVVFIADTSLLGDLRLNGEGIYDAVGNVLIEDDLDISGDLNVGSGADIVADGKAAVVTARSSSEMSMIDYGVAIMTSGVTYITFTSPFASAPVVVATYAGTSPSAADLTALDVTEIAAIGAKVEGDSTGTHSINWIAIGQK